jgi:replicative DNA helicase
MDHSKDFQRRRKTSIDISTTLYGKVPPQAKELEEAIIGAIMLEPKAYDIAAEILKPESFYVEAHQKIFRAFQFLDNNQQPIDMLTTVEALKVMEELEFVGGPYFIAKITNNVVSGANIEIHSRIVLEKYIMREMIRLSGETITAAYEDTTDFKELINKHEATLGLITTGNLKSNFSDTTAVGAKEINRLYDLQKNPTSLTGINTGYSILNHLTGGWQDTDLIIIAGRPSMGKTAIALNFLRSAANTVPVGMFSLEMSKEQLMRRMLCSESRIYLDKLNNGKMTMEELEAVVMANDRINRLKIFIDDTGGLDIFELRSRARRMVSKHGVRLIVIDYLQIMSGEGIKGQNREQEISTISRKLKGLAKELRVPIIALSQMSRDIEKRKGEPMLSDLRDSGAIEQDADMVLFGWRDNYQVTDVGEVSNGAYIKVAKNRNGALDKLAFKTDMRIQTWFDMGQWAIYEPYYQPF